MADEGKVFCYNSGLPFAAAPHFQKLFDRIATLENTAASVRAVTQVQERVDVLEAAQKRATEIKNQQEATELRRQQEASEKGTRPGDSRITLGASDTNHPEEPHYGNVGNTINPNTGRYDGF